VRWRPAPQKWSLLEILNHLCDEERDDFRRRVQLTLENQETPWPPIDPEGWVSERNYNERDFEASLRDFAEERARSLVWLHGLKDPNWDHTYLHPTLGSFSAGDLLASWAAHDLLHIRQISDTMAAYVAQSAEPYSTRYALP